jgi:hypothetical protein
MPEDKIVVENVLQYDNTDSYGKNLKYYLSKTINI